MIVLSCPKSVFVPVISTCSVRVWGVFCSSFVRFVPMKLHYFQTNVYKNIALNCSFFLGRRVSFSTCQPSLNMGKEKPQVYVTRAGCPAKGIDLLKQKCDVEIWSKPLEPVPREELLKKVKGKDALFCLLTDKIDKELLESAGPSLKVIATMSTGYDHIDVPEIKKRGIKLGYTPDVLTDAVAELTVGLLLATSRRLFEAHQEILNGGWGSWSPLWMCGPGLATSTVGIVGLGRIGIEVAKRLHTFNPSQILYTSRSDKPEAKPFGGIRVPLDELLAQSDFIVVTCALTPETKEMFNDETFAKMKSSAIFVNTSRGGVVDQPALQRALESGKIAAAGLDVMTPEPLPPDHPLLQLKNCVIIPHIGSATTKTREDMCILTAKNIIAALQGEPLPAEL
ncbi:Glyoxylate reductase/hydroxypyruvate reductase [Gryllus bimaculatus]|nr:Glyoxylate reductase/hydroxypyruvate reductase [Gryllus bimaculatus]